MNDLLSTLVVNVARVALSNVLWLVDVVFGPTLVPRVGVVFGSFFDLWNSFVFGYNNHRHSVEERNLLSFANKFPSCWCCDISVHVPTSFSCCGRQPVYTAKKSSTDVEESGDFVQTRGLTFGDNVTHFFDSFQCRRMLRTVEHLFLLVSVF